MSVIGFWGPEFLLAWEARLVPLDGAMVDAAATGDGPLFEYAVEHLGAALFHLLRGERTQPAAMSCG